MAHSTQFWDWRKLNFDDRSIHNYLNRSWSKLLNNKTVKEHHYHSFLAKHPGFFLSTTWDSFLVVSKLKLGSELETDFVVLEDHHSLGIKYLLVELESPHSKPFTASGNPSAKLTHAMQQIRNWQRWLIDNSFTFSKYFPNLNRRVIRSGNLKYRIVIGRRKDYLGFEDVRGQIIEESKIEIVSFDRLTDEFKSHSRHFDGFTSSTEMDKLPFSVRNELANPFYTAITDSTWKTICNKFEVSHAFANNAEIILKHREHNELLKKFKRKKSNSQA